MSMFNEERIFFKAWLDEENRIVSFHEIPGFFRILCLRLQ